MMKKECCNLWDVVAHLLMMSHGQASMERGFPVNKQMEHKNISHETSRSRYTVFLDCLQVTQRRGSVLSTR